MSFLISLSEANSHHPRSTPKTPLSALTPDGALQDFAILHFQKVTQIQGFPAIAVDGCNFLIIAIFLQKKKKQNFWEFPQQIRWLLAASITTNPCKILEGLTSKQKSKRGFPQELLLGFTWGLTLLWKPSSEQTVPLCAWRSFAFPVDRPQNWTLRGGNCTRLSLIR